MKELAKPPLDSARREIEGISNFLAVLEAIIFMLKKMWFVLVVPIAAKILEPKQE